MHPAQLRGGALFACHFGKYIQVAYAARLTNKVSEKLATEVNLFINKRPTDKRANKWPNNRCRNPEEKIRQGPEPQ